VDAGVCLHPSTDNPSDFYVAVPAFPADCAGDTANAPDGTWYLHIRARNGAGLWSAPVHVRHRFDRTAPIGPSSPTATCSAEGTTSTGPTLTMGWGPGSDATSGLRGYSWAWNSTAATPADTTFTEGDPAATSTTSAPLADGTWYFHLRALDNATDRDGASNASPDTTYGPVTVTDGAITARPGTDFTALWADRFTDTAFNDTWLATTAITQSILDEGFHSLAPDIQAGLIACLADELAEHPDLAGQPTQDIVTTLAGYVFDKTQILEPLTAHNVAATRGDTTATVTWDAPLLALNGITTYTVTAYQAADNAPVATATTTAPTTTATVTGLRNGTPVYFRVQATYIVLTGPSSLASNTVTPAGPPFAPEAVTATRGDTQATVTWAPPTEHPDGTPGNNGEPITTYTVTATPGGATTTVDGTTTTATITGLRNGTSYTFTATATNVVGTGPASTPSNAITPAGVPFAPENVSAIAGDQVATVTWDPPAPRADGTPGDNGDPISTYTVTASPGGSSTTVGGGTTSTDVTGLDNGSAYTFTVTATTTVGTGAASAASNVVRPAGAPSTPTNVVAYPRDGMVVVGWSPSSSNGAPVTYRVEASPGGAVEFSPGTTVLFDGLTNGTSYTFIVRAQNSAGQSAYSDPSAAVTPVAVTAPPPPSTSTCQTNPLPDPPRRGTLCGWEPPPPDRSSVLARLRSSPNGLLHRVR
jgi:hypothetical protein